MTLDEYLSSSGAMSVSALRAAIGAKSDAQIRQWRHEQSVARTKRMRPDLLSG
jgi:tRNA G37 N-methylase TrmD